MQKYLDVATALHATPLERYPQNKTDAGGYTSHSVPCTLQNAACRTRPSRHTNADRQTLNPPAMASRPELIASLDTGSLYFCTEGPSWKRGATLSTDSEFLIHMQARRRAGTQARKHVCAHTCTHTHVHTHTHTNLRGCMCRRVPTRTRVQVFARRKAWPHKKSDFALMLMLSDKE